jgi:hypothetical protein
VNAFTLTEEHLKLLKSACLYWEDCETGAPAIDPKRPYGNSGVAEDVIEILGWEDPHCPRCGEPIDEGKSIELRRRALEIHTETLIALEIILSTQCFGPGKYYRQSSAHPWECVNEL